MAVVETYDPTGTLKSVTEGVWIVDDQVIRFGYACARSAGRRPIGPAVC